MRPEPGTYPSYYENYIPLIKENDCIAALSNNREIIKKVLSGIPTSKENYAYAKGKWTVKELIQHLIDTERIISYRALRFARKDPQQPLAFDENLYAQNADVTNRNIPEMLEELDIVRQGTIHLFKTFTHESLLLTGHTSFGQTTVLALGYLIPGHVLHHFNVLNERYSI